MLQADLGLGEVWVQHRACYLDENYVTRRQAGRTGGRDDLLLSLAPPPGAVYGWTTDVAAGQQLSLLKRFVLEDADLGKIGGWPQNGS